MRKSTNEKIESYIFWGRARIGAWSILILASLLTLGIILFPVSSEISSGTLVAVRHIESKNPPYKGVCLIRLDSGKELALPCVPQGRRNGASVQLSVESRLITPWKKITVLPIMGAPPDTTR